jgi:cytochrome c553
VIALLALLAGAAGGAPAATPAPAPAAPARAEACASCHGPDGNSRDPAVPSLAGQQAAYLSLQLVQYREDRRQDDRMSPFAKDLSDADVEALAAWYAARRPKGGGRALAPAKAAAGRKVAEANHCGSCHMPDLGGQRHVPRLAGQHYEYLLQQMRGFKAQTRAELDGSMTMAAQALSARDIEDVVAWIASLPAVPPGAAAGDGRAPGR